MGFGALGGAVEQWKKGRRSVKLSGWLPGQPDEARYAAAEYLCHLWYEAAVQQGQHHPVRKFAEWLRKFPAGPVHAQVLQWMKETSGLDLGPLAENVQLIDVIRHHAETWKAAGLEMDPDTAKILKKTRG